MLNKARNLAIKYHEGQIDKSGNDYRIHLDTVATCCSTEEEQQVALLHDILEDTSCTGKVLEENGFSDNVIEAILMITKDNGEDYGVYLSRVKSNVLARGVKICDLKHNMDLSRLNEISEDDIKRCEKYKKALDYLSE